MSDAVRGWWLGDCTKINYISYFMEEDREQTQIIRMDYDIIRSRVYEQWMRSRSTFMVNNTNKYTCNKQRVKLYLL